MKNFIGTKHIKAEPMTRGQYNDFKGWPIPNDEDPNDPGYLVKYSDDYISWSSAAPFEKSYMEISENNTITKQNIYDFIAWDKATKLGDKTTVLQVGLVNGFIITESSSCVDPKNFDMQVGTDICMERVHNKVWELLGFLLQTAVGGVQ